MAKKQETKPEAKQVNICWVTGNHHQRQMVIAKVKDYLKSKGDYETSVYSGEETFEYVSSQIAQRSCFDEGQRLVMINDWPAHKVTKPTMYKHFLKMLQDADPSIVIICNNLQTDAESFMKVIRDIARVYEYENEIKQWEAARWFRAEMAKREREITETDAEAVVQAVGPNESGYVYDLDKLYLSIDKLISFVGNRKIIKSDDVQLVFGDSANFIIWNLYNFLDSKDFYGAVRLAAGGFVSTKDASRVVEEILYPLISRYRMLLFLKEGSAQGWDTTAICLEIAKLGKLKRTGSGFGARCTLDTTENGSLKPMYSQKWVEKAFDSGRGKPPVMCYSRKELFEIVQAAEQTLYRVREGCTDAEAIALLDGLFMTACGIGDPELLAQQRSVDYESLY
jgi:DNA polymerase III delta subunit